MASVFGMAQGLPRTSFNRSSLVRTLADLAVAEAAESRQSFAERLGQWLDFKDALPLYSVLNASADTALGHGVASPQTAAIREDLARVRSTLSDSIAADGVSGSGKVRIQLPTPLSGASADSAAEFAPYQRYYLAHQRDMTASIGPLRVSARAALSACSASLKQLAALDAVLEQALQARERSLLASVPALLAKRFEKRYADHLAARVDADTADDPSQWMQPGGWLAVFCKELQNVLLAELDLRLQPIVGMIDAVGNEVAREQ